MILMGKEGGGRGRVCGEKLGWVGLGLDSRSCS